MTVKEPPKPPKTQKGKKNQKSKSNKKPNKTQSNKTKVQLSENDLKLIIQYLETNRTEAITTNRIIEEALGKKPERALQMEVSDILKYFIDIKEIRKMIYEEGKYYAATL